jgi:hypothetical protein
MRLYQSTRFAIITFVAGWGLLIPAGIGLLLSDVPTIFCPFPMLTVFPVFLLSSWHLWRAVICVPTLLFFAWHPKLFRGAARVPIRSSALYASATILSVLYFATGWKWGLQYQGAQYTQVVCAVNTAWVILLGLGFARSWTGSSSFRFNLFLHWMLFAWLAWYAFPYMGELP